MTKHTRQKTKDDYLAEAAAIRQFGEACAYARSLLPSVSHLGKDQRRLVIGMALVGLEAASPVDYSQAVNLLLGGGRHG